MCHWVIIKQLKRLNIPEEVTLTLTLLLKIKRYLTMSPYVFPKQKEF